MIHLIAEVSSQATVAKCGPIPKSAKWTSMLSECTCPGCLALYSPAQRKVLP